MKRPLKKKVARMARRMPTAVVVSILIHAVLILLAGGLVAFATTKKSKAKIDVKVVPAGVTEQSKMQMRKPKPTIFGNIALNPSARIETEPNTEHAGMPKIKLPEIPELGAAHRGGGFGPCPCYLDFTSVFGSNQSIGNDFTGTFYDFNRHRTGRPLATAMNRDRYLEELMRFFQKGWNPWELAGYYRSPMKRYATTIMVPPIPVAELPARLGEPEAKPGGWAMLYKGSLVHRDAITFRFWGKGDNIMLVRVDGRIVLNTCLQGDKGKGALAYFSPLWKSHSPDTDRNHLGSNTFIEGDWISLEAGVPLDMQVLIGNNPGILVLHPRKREAMNAMFCAMLLVEVKGIEYEKTQQETPILPIFKTEEPSSELLNAIYREHVPDDVCITNGPVFRDF